MNATAAHRYESPPFDEAVSVLRSFLRQQGQNDNIRWIWRNSIITRRGSGSYKVTNRRIFIDRHALADEESIRSYYNFGIERGLGIDLRVYCLVDGNPHCFIHIPKDAIDAEYTMMSSLNCSIPTQCPKATMIHNQFVASILRFLLRAPKSAWDMERIPLRPGRT